jgi:RHS repeat-associated protein
MNHFENRLTKVQLPSGIVNTFTFNGDGQRVQIQDSSATTKQVYDGQKVALETDQTNSTIAVYTSSPGVYGDLVSQKRLLVPHYHVFDPLGSTDRLTSSSATVTDTYIYKGFGEIIFAGATTNPLRFIGRLGYWYSADLRAPHVRRRTLLTILARWTCQDPLGIGNRANPYTYVVNRPLTFTDPSGLFAIEPNLVNDSSVHSWDPRDKTNAGASNRHWVFAQGDLRAVIQKVESEASFEVTHCCPMFCGFGLTVGLGTSSATFTESYVELWMAPEGGGQSAQVENHRKGTKIIADYVLKHCSIRNLRKTVVAWSFDMTADFEAFNVSFNVGEWNADTFYKGTNAFRVTSLVCCGVPVDPPPVDPGLRNLYPQGGAPKRELDGAFPPGPPNAQIHQPPLTAHDEWSARWNCGMRKTTLEYVTTGYR